MSDELVGGTVGLALLVAFLGVMIAWVPAPPLIVIALVVIAMLLWDLGRTLRQGNGGRDGR